MARYSYMIPRDTKGDGRILMIFSKKLMRMYFVFKKQNYKKIKQMQYNLRDIIDI